MIATALFLVESLAPNDNVFERTAVSSHAADLTGAQQAEADRLAGLAEARTMGEVLQGSPASPGQSGAMGGPGPEHHRHLRAKRAETNRLTGLAESQSLVTP